MGTSTSDTATTNGPLLLIQTIPLPKVEGRIDHLSVDIKDQRLFVAALGNDTVEIIDLAAGKVIHSISGLSDVVHPKHWTVVLNKIDYSKEGVQNAPETKFQCRI
jgi:hypothetical protein